MDLATSDAILRNAIFSNGNLGIELGSGDNDGQEFPVPASAVTVGFTGEPKPISAFSPWHQPERKVTLKKELSRG